MITRIAALLAPICFLFFTACGGGGKTKPPQVAQNTTAIDQQMLDNLYNHAQQAKQVCSQDITPIAMQYVMALMQAQQQQGCLGSPIPNTPGGTTTTPATTPTAIPNGFGGNVPSSLVAAAPPQTQCGLNPVQMPQPRQVSQACKDAIMNFVMTFNTIKLSNGTLYANNPQAQQWFQAQFVDLINMVGGNVMAQVPGLPVNNVAFLGQMAQMGVSMGQNLVSQVPQLASVASNAPQLLASNLPPAVYQYLQQAGLTQ